MPMDLGDELALEVSTELLRCHGIDVTYFWPGSITLGADAGYKEALYRWEKQAQTKKGQQYENLGTAATEQRKIARFVSRKLQNVSPKSWNIYTVQREGKGFFASDLSFMGHRKHPSLRTGHKGEVKFDCSGSEVQLYLPPLSYKAAVGLLTDVGFQCNEQNYTPQTGWQFIFSNPEVPLHIEESALKAMSAISNGQLAVGLNGINSYGVKWRSDSLRSSLKALARNKRSITVRFDHGDSSTREAKKLGRALIKAGADACWYCWKSHGPHKTDDYFAAIRHGYEDPITNQHLVGLSLVETTEDYYRLKKPWIGQTIKREFLGSDLALAQTKSRVICLAGATGTAKTKATLQFVESIEANRGVKLQILGLYHRKSLVHKGAYEYGVRDLSAEYGTAERDGFHEERNLRTGLFCCCESIKKETNETDLVDLSWTLQENPRQTLLVLDEITQSLLTLLHGGTDPLVPKRAVSLQALERLIQNPCVNVIAADAGLGDLEVDWLRDVSGVEPYLIRTTFTRSRDIYIGPVNKDNLNSLTMMAGQHLAKGQRVKGSKGQRVKGSKGQRVWLGFGEKRRLESFIKPFSDYPQIVISSDTSSSREANAFVSDPNKSIRNLQLVACSPSVTSGISLDAESVALASVVQAVAMTAEDTLQSVNRPRRSDWRVVLSPPQMPQALIGKRQTSSQTTLEAYQYSANNSDTAVYGDFFNAMSLPSRHLFIGLEARQNYEALNNTSVLRSRLIQEGYNIKEFSELGFDAQFMGLQINPKQAEEHATTIKERLLKQILLGEVTQAEAIREARRCVAGGLIGDLNTADPVPAAKWLIRLGLPALLQCDELMNDTPEVQMMWDQMTILDSKEVKQLKREVGRVNIPTHEDELNMRPIITILRRCGYKAKRKQRRSNGTVVSSYWLEESS